MRTVTGSVFGLNRSDRLATRLRASLSGPRTRRGLFHTWIRSGTSAARLLFDEWYGAATSAVANLRTVLAHDPNAPDLAALVNELTRDSRDFAQLWGHYDVTPRRSKPKVFHHPVAGDMTLWHEVLRLSDDGQRLGIYQAPPGSPDHDALTLLAMAAGESELEQARS